LNEPATRCDLYALGKLGRHPQLARSRHTLQIRFGLPQRVDKFFSCRRELDPLQVGAERYAVLALEAAHGGRYGKQYLACDESILIFQPRVGRRPGTLWIEGHASLANSAW